MYTHVQGIVIFFEVPGTQIGIFCAYGLRNIWLAFLGGGEKL
jgi:hypothetical protein